MEKTDITKTVDSVNKQQSALEAEGGDWYQNWNHVLSEVSNFNKNMWRSKKQESVTPTQEKKRKKKKQATETGCKREKCEI